MSCLAYSVSRETLRDDLNMSEIPRKGRPKAGHSPTKARVFYPILKVLCTSIMGKYVGIIEQPVSVVLVLSKNCVENRPAFVRMRLANPYAINHPKIAHFMH